MLLTEKRPTIEEFEFRGRVFNIDMAFNNILTVLEIIEDKEMSNAQKQLDILYMITGEDEFSAGYYTDAETVEYTNELQHKLMKKIFQKEEQADGYLVDIAGNKFKPEKKDKKEKEVQKTYDFQQDAGMIYAAFLQAYSIDLYQQADALHWEVFIELFKALPNDTKIMQVIDIRTRDLPTGKGTSKEREQLQKLKETYKLKQ